MSVAKLIRFNGTTTKLNSPITLTLFQTSVGGFIRFIDLTSGDILVVNEHINNHPADFSHFNNPTATIICGRPVLGDVVLCSPSEIQ